MLDRYDSDVADDAAADVVVDGVAGAVGDESDRG